MRTCCSQTCASTDNCVCIALKPRVNARRFTLIYTHPHASDVEHLLRVLRNDTTSSRPGAQGETPTAMPIPEYGGRRGRGAGVIFVVFVCDNATDWELTLSPAAAVGMGSMRQHLEGA